MSRIHLGMKRPLKKFNESVIEMCQYIEAFNFMPPRGDGAKECAIDEWKECINNVIIQINNIKNTQIDLIMRGGEDD